MGFIKKHWIEILIFLVSLSIYSFGSSRSIVHGDTGEFLSVAASHGVAHPPGFPLYSFVISLVFLVTQNTWIVTLMSALFASIALVFVYMTVKQITKNIPSSLIAALSLGVFETFWFYAQVAQIHVFHVFIESVFLYILILCIKKKSLKLLYLVFFLLGIGFTSHQAMIFLAPALLYTLFVLKKILNTKRLLLLGLCSFLGLFPYLYIPVASATNPPVNWGLVHDLNSLLAVFFRKDYGYFLLSKNETGAPFIYSTFIHYFKNIIASGWYLLPFFFTALHGVYRKNVLNTVVFLCFLFTGPIFYVLMNVPVRTVVHQTVIEQYIPYSYIFLSVLIGIGAEFVLKKIKFKKTLIITLCVLIVFAIQASITFQKIRLDNNNIVETSTKFIFSQIPKNGIILTWSDSLYLPTLYEQLVKKERPDITIIQVGTVNLDWYPLFLKRFHPGFAKYVVSKTFQYKKICNDFAQKNLLYVYPWFSDFADVFGKDCSIIPIGLVNKVVKTSNIPNVEDIMKGNDNQWKKYADLVKFENYKNRSIRTREELYYIGEQLNFVSLYYMLNQKDEWAIKELELASSVSPDEVSSLITESAILYKNGKYEKAIQVLEEAKNRNPAIPDIYKNLGLINEKMGDAENTVLNLKTYLEFNPPDPQIPALQEKINMYEKSDTNVRTNLVAP